MASVDELERAVQDLPAEDLKKFRLWFLGFDAQVWDRQIEEDVEAGKLDRFAEEALRDLREGRTRPLH